MAGLACQQINASVEQHPADNRHITRQGLPPPRSFQHQTALLTGASKHPGTALGRGEVQHYLVEHGEIAPQNPEFEHGKSAPQNPRFGW